MVVEAAPTSAGWLADSSVHQRPARYRRNGAPSIRAQRTTRLLPATVVVLTPTGPSMAPSGPITSAMTCGPYRYVNGHDEERLIVERNDKNWFLHEVSLAAASRNTFRVNDGYGIFVTDSERATSTIARWPTMRAAASVTVRIVAGGWGPRVVGSARMGLQCDIS
jgi:hypothetical protein